LGPSLLPCLEVARRGGRVPPGAAKVERRSLPLQVWKTTEKEDYVVTTRVAPSTVLECAIEELLREGLANNNHLAELGRLGAPLVLQRAVEEEATEFLGRARYQRTVGSRRMGFLNPTGL